MSDDTYNNDAGSGGGGGRRRKNDYEVGYGKPPKSGQFQAGESGNPKGRKKGSKNTKTVVRETLNRRITVQTHEGRRRITIQQGVLWRLSDSALKDDHRSQKLLLDLAREFNNEDLEAQVKGVSADDSEILENYYQRRRRQKEAGNDDGTDSNDPGDGSDDQGEPPDGDGEK